MQYLRLSNRTSLAPARISLAYFAATDVYSIASLFGVFLG